MANFKLNKEYTPIYGDYLYFTEVPNIYKVEESANGSKATLVLIFDDNLNATVSADSQYYITLFGETVSNVMDADKAMNKRFFIQGDGESTANSVCNALRNCSGIAAQWNIYQTWNGIYLTAKDIGQKFQSQYKDTNITSEYLRFTATDGSATSRLYASKINVDVFEGETPNAANYITHLEKNFYGDECAFDISPVLATMSEYGKAKKFCLNASMTAKEGWWDALNTVSGYTTIGYSVNGSEPYIPFIDGGMILHHNIVNYKPMIRYVYGQTIQLSYLLDVSQTNFGVTVTYLDSAYNTITAITSTYSKTGESLIQDLEIPLYSYDNVYYIDLTVGNDTVRYNVIKPLKATEYYQRICWRNEYGGVSFFDYTAAKTETTSVSPSTYEKNIFDYYDIQAFEKKKIYDNDYKKTIKLTSHLLEKDGTYIFNSLAKSKRVWTYIDGQRYYIIPQTIEVTESNDYNNIFTSTITYTYSYI